MNTTRITSTSASNQRALDFLDAFGHRQRGVERNHVVQIRREALLDFLHHLLGAAGGLQRVGAGHLVQRDKRGGLAVEPAFHVVGLCAEFDARDILDPHDGTIGVGAQDDPRQILPGSAGGLAHARRR
jgi:hypothetical protein